MTNLVSNRLEVEGSKDAIDRFLDGCFSTVNGRRTLHLEKMKPIPTVFAGVEESGDAEIGIEILTRRPLEIPGAQSALGYSWITKIGIETYDQLERWARSKRPAAIEAGQKSLQAFAETGHYFSGAWAEDNWGTRYIIDAAIIEQSDVRVVATFHTAWAPAIKLYREMVRRLPGLSIYLVADDEAQDLSYRFVSYDGVVKEDRYVASNQARP